MKTNTPRRIGNQWVLPNGKRLPVISGGDGPVSIDDLKAQKVGILDQIDDILNTAKEATRSLTDQERVDHDALVAELDTADEAIRTATAEAGDARRNADQEARRSAPPVPMVNLNRGTAGNVTRNLDDYLWSTDEAVRSGGYDKTGTWRDNPYGASTAVEQIAVRSGDGTGHYAPRITEFQPQDRSALRNFQNTVADMALGGLLIDRSARTSAEGFEAARSHKAFTERWATALRALDVDTAAEGTEWVPTGIGASLHEKVRASGKVAGLFARIDLPTNPWKWPLEGADATAYRVAEPTSDTATKVTASTPGTAAATFDAEILGGRIITSRSLEADSALAILPFMRAKLVRAFVDAEEKAILDGDSDGTHQDTDTQAVGATHASSSWDGLRKRALAETTQATTASTVANLRLIQAAMGKWGVNPNDLAFIVGLSAYYDLLGDTEVTSVDKLGPQATILNGQLASLNGIPIIVSEHVRENLNASGVHDGITETKTYNLCVNRNEWAMGQRMALDVEVDDSIYRETFQRVIVGFMREDFQSIAGVSTDDTTSIGYNVTP